MSGRIIHYGIDEFFRLDTLRTRGYSVETCTSPSELRWALYFGLRADLVIFSEAPGTVPYRAMSLARARHTPLALFQSWSPHYEESEFSLVVPAMTTSELWLNDIACLVRRQRNLVPWAAAVPFRPVARRRACDPHDRTFLQFPQQSPQAPSASAAPEWPRSDSGFLSALDEETMHELFALLRFSNCPPGTILFLEEQPSREVSFILTGQVKLSVNSSDGRRFITHIAGPGEALGLAAAFTSTAHQVTAETAYQSEIASIPAAAFLDFLQHHPHVFPAAARELGRGYNQACARLRTVGVNLTVMKKMAGLLLEWSTAGSSTGRGTQIHLALTHMEIGQCIGTTRESVTRVLHDFQRRRIIDQKGSILTIIDRIALEGCAAIY